MNDIITPRLHLRRLELGDAPFIFELVNSAGWKRYIGERNVHTPGDAERYILEGPQASYEAHGFGLLLVIRKSDNKPMGMCGLLKRQTLNRPDAGFAFLPQYCGSGYATEALAAVLDWCARNGVQDVCAITTPDNHPSQRVLTRNGFVFEQETSNERGEPLHLFGRRGSA